VKKLLVGAITASLLVAVVVYTASALQTPTYEASAKVLVGPKDPSDGKIHLIPLSPPYPNLQQLTHTLWEAIESRPVADEAIRRLDLRMSPDELQTNLTVEQVEPSQIIQLSYTDTDPGQAMQIVNTVGQVSSERVSVKSEANYVTATLYDKASVPDAPISPQPLTNGLIALVAGLALSAVLIEARRRAQLDEGRER
jgi:capsular polysaccharide biosynthesis protein